MSGDEHDLDGNRESPMAYDGGLQSIGEPNYFPVDPSGHPPIPCPAPRYGADLRGRVRCPWCGAKARLDGEPTFLGEARESADRARSAIGGALAQCWEVTADTAWWLACLPGRALEWRRERKTQDQDRED